MAGMGRRADFQREGATFKFLAIASTPRRARHASLWRTTATRYTTRQVKGGCMKDAVSSGRAFEKEIAASISGGHGRIADFVKATKNQDWATMT